MAVAKEHPRIQVEVICEREPLREYDNDDEETPPEQVTKYIEAKSGAEFGVRLELKRPYPSDPVYFRLYLDGKDVGNRIIGDVQYGIGGNSDMGESGADGDEVSFVSAVKRPRHHVTMDEDGIETIDLT
jgi:hypothetical protein